MVRLRVLEILDEQDQTKYWLYKQMGMLNYNHFLHIIENETSSIKFETLAKLCQILDVPVEELFVRTRNKCGD